MFKIGREDFGKDFKYSDVFTTDESFVGNEIVKMKNELEELSHLATDERAKLPYLVFEKNEVGHFKD